MFSGNDDHKGPRFENHAVDVYHTRFKNVFIGLPMYVNMKKNMRGGEGITAKRQQRFPLGRSVELQARGGQETPDNLG